MLERRGLAMPTRLHATASALRLVLVGAVLSGLPLAIPGCASAGGKDRWRERPYDPPRAVAQIRTEDGRCPGSAGPAPTDARLRLGLPGPVSSLDAPLAVTEAERHIFANLYETLVRVDCDGAARPGLASTWAAFDGGRTWVFVLRPGATFWDGVPVSAADVIASWRRGAQIRAARGEPATGGALDLGRGAAVAAGRDTVVIHLPQPLERLPLLLANPSLVTARSGPGAWPLGTGPCRVDTAPGLADTLRLRPNPAHPRAPRWSTLTVVDTQAARGDGNLDAVVVRERDAVAMWQRRGLRAHPLPWDRVYLLACPPADGERSPAERQRWTTGWSARALARETVAEAWPAEDPFFVEPGANVCPELPGPVTRLDWPSFSWPAVAASRDIDLVLYPRGWPEAGRLAEALAEAAAQPRRPGRDVVGRGPLTPDFPPSGAAAPQAVAVPAADFPGAFQSGRAGAYILPLWRDDATACAQLADLVTRADWLQNAAMGAGDETTVVPPGATAPTPAETTNIPRAQRIALRLARDQVLLSLMRTRATLLLRPTADMVWDATGRLDLGAPSTGQ